MTENISIEDNLDEVFVDWLQTIWEYAINTRPDLAEEISNVIHSRHFIERNQSKEYSHLKNKTIAEIGSLYETILLKHDPVNKKTRGQFYTPDDVAEFMGRKASQFPEGTWVDPCCGTGILAWWLTKSQKNPSDFLKHKLTLVDIDKVSLTTAIILISIDFVDINQKGVLTSFNERCSTESFLDYSPVADYATLNPPYGVTPKNENLITGDTRELYSYFLEKTTTSYKGFISVTPATYQNAKKFSSLRNLLEERFNGCRIYTFDNMPAALFDSPTNRETISVRASIIDTNPNHNNWQLTPIIRWLTANRPNLFTKIDKLLYPMAKDGEEWLKIFNPNQWVPLLKNTKLGSMVSTTVTDYKLTLASTPRYYISAVKRNINRGSKVELYFNNKEDYDRAYLVLNSSLPYFWWRATDTSFLLSKRTLLSMPIPEFNIDQNLIKEIEDSEQVNLVVKNNAGKPSENVKHSQGLTKKINAQVIPNFSENTFHNFYVNDCLVK